MDGGALPRSAGLPPTLALLEPAIFTEPSNFRRLGIGGTMTDMNGTRGMKLIAGNSNRELAEKIGQYLKLPFTKAVVRRFADMEVFVEIQENVRGEDIFVIQSTSYPANDNLMELLIVIDALQARKRPAHHRGDSVFRLCPPGPQSGSAHADLGQACRQPDHRSRRQPRSDGGSACRPDPGLLRYSD